MSELERSLSLWQITLMSIGIILGAGIYVVIGEAAGLISPSSAEGISYALKSGAILAECINSSIDNYESEYKLKTIKLRINIFMKNLKAILMYNKFARKLIMKTGVFSMKNDIIKLYK